MGFPAAKMGDKMISVPPDIHIILIPTPGGPVPTPLPHPFVGSITGSCSNNVKIQNMGAAVVGSEAQNMPPHIPQGGPFQKPPMNKAKIIKGSMTVMANNKPLARLNDMGMVCADPVDTPTCKVIGTSTVIVGG